MSDAIRPSFGGADRVKPPIIHRDSKDTRRAPGPAFLDMLAADDARSLPDQRGSGTIAQEGGFPRPIHLRAPDGPSTPAGDPRFNSHLTKSDQAVAFDARPVVGPASVAMPEVGLVQVERTGRDQTGALRLDPAGHELWGGPARVELSSLLSEAIPATAMPPAIGRQKALPSPSSTQSITAIAGPQLAAAVDRPDGIDTMAPEPLPDLDPRRVEGSGRSRQANEHQQARANLLAKMIPSDEDYRLLLRGPALEPLQMRSIKRVIGNLIRAFGLPDMPIHINWNRKGR